MKLFNGKARYPEFDEAYDIYMKRSCKSLCTMSKGDFVKVIRMYCKAVADKLEESGFTDLPFDIGSLSAVRIAKAPRYNRQTGRSMPSDNIDWDATRESGEITRGGSNVTFGICFVPRMVKGRENFRSFGIVANRQLYRRMKDKFDNGDLGFYVTDIETYL